MENANKREGTDVGYRIERTRDCKLPGGSSTSRREPVRFMAINSYLIRNEISMYSLISLHNDTT